MQSTLYLRKVLRRRTKNYFKTKYYMSKKFLCKQNHRELLSSLTMFIIIPLKHDIHKKIHNNSSFIKMTEKNPNEIFGSFLFEFYILKTALKKKKNCSFIK